MAFTKITDADLQGKGVVGQAPVPGLPVKEMQESVEQIVREVAIPGINRLADELSAQTAAKNIGMQVPDGMPGGASANVSSVVGTHVLSTGNPHKVTAEQVGAYTKEQTDQAINQKVQDIGAGDMSKSEYARTGTYGAVDRALSADRAVQSDDGVKVYTHTKSGTVHNFAGTGANGRAKLTADVQAGDTFTVNGVPVAAYMGSDDATSSMAGNPWNGKWVTFVTQAGVLNFPGNKKYEPTAYSTEGWVSTGEIWVDGKPIKMKCYKIDGSDLTPSEIEPSGTIQEIVSYGGNYDTGFNEMRGIPDAYTGAVGNRAFSISAPAGALKWNYTFNGDTAKAKNVRLWVKATLVAD